LIEKTPSNPFPFWCQYSRFRIPQSTIFFAMRSSRKRNPHDFVCIPPFLLVEKIHFVHVEQAKNGRNRGGNSSQICVESTIIYIYTSS
jgi:hypothetical protein